MKFTLRKALLAIATVVCSLPAFAVVNDIELKYVTPREGDLDIEYRSLEQITLAFTTDVNVRPNTLAYLTTPDGQELTAEMKRNSYLKNTVLIDFPEIVYYNGDYTLTIKRWSVGDDEWLADYEQGHSNPEIKIVWTVSNGLTVGADYDLQPVSVLPANGSVFTYPDKPLSLVQITMPAGAVINPDAEAVLSCVEARYSSALTFVAENKGKNIVYTADISPTPSVKGDYTLIFPAGMFGDEQYIAEQKGHASPDISLVYTIDLANEESTGDEETVDWTLKPANAELKAEGDDYTLRWEWSSVANMNAAALTEWKVIDNKGYKVSDLTFSLLDEAEPKSGVKFSAELNQESKYTLLVPQAMFFDAEYETSKGLQGMANPQLRYDFVPKDIMTSGVTAAVEDKPAVRSVYTSQGILLYADATDAQIGALAPGLYIIAGKKVMVK